MLVSELEAKAKEELAEEKAEMTKEVVKERLREIIAAKKVLIKLEKQYKELLEKDVEEVEEDDKSCC